MRIDILTLFPECCEAVLGESIIGRARISGAVEIHCHNIRDYTTDRHGRVDDAPYGGGMGMIMSAQPIFDCFSALFGDLPEKPLTLYMSPKGTIFTQEKARELSRVPHLVLLCGHYEGVDQRVLDEIVDGEISIGDYVLTGGELAAAVVTDAVARMLPGVLSDDLCFEEESHYNGLLEFPQYTRPAVWHEKPVPEVLLSGHHANIERWRREQSLLVTKNKRPDMLSSAALTEADRRFLENAERG